MNRIQVRSSEGLRRDGVATDVPQVLKAGVTATCALTALALPAMASGGLRLNFGKLLGTMFAPDSPRTRALGWGLYAVNGALLAGAYQAIFARSKTPPTAARGAALGAAHAATAMAALALLPRLHPRPFMAGLHPWSASAYGPLTVPGILAGHLAYGAMLGAMLGEEAAPAA